MFLADCLLWIMRELELLRGTEARREWLIAGWFVVMVGLLMAANTTWHPSSIFAGGTSSWRGIPSALPKSARAHVAEAVCSDVIEYAARGDSRPARPRSALPPHGPPDARTSDPGSSPRPVQRTGGTAALGCPQSALAGRTAARPSTAPNVNPVKGLLAALWEHSREFNNCWHGGLGYKIPFSREPQG